MKIFIIMLSMLFSTTPAYACDVCEPVPDDSFISMSNSVIFNANYQSIKSDYSGLGETGESIGTLTADLFSNVKIGDDFLITSTLRAVRRDYGTDFGNDFPGIENTDHDRIDERQYNDVHFRSLYLTYILPEFDNGYKHMIAGGTMPFQGGAWKNYKIGGPQEADGLSMMFNMPFDALVYVADFSNMIESDFLQVRIGHGDYMKFRGIYPQNEQINTISSPYDTTVSFVNFDYKDGPHNFKAEYYRTDWVFDTVNVGVTNHYGLGYAFDKMDTDGYVVYGSVSYVDAPANFEGALQHKLNTDRDDLIAGMMYQYGMDYNTAAGTVDYNLANPSIGFYTGATGLTEEDLGLGEEYSGWAFQLGVRKEFWIEKYDVDWFVGAEYFRSSKDWVTATFRGYPRSGIDTLIKGQAVDLYTGIKFDDGKIVTLSWVHEERDYGVSAVNLGVGVDFDESNRHLIKNRDTIMINFTWMFMDL